VVARGGDRGNGEMLIMGYELSVIRLINSGNLMYTIRVNDTALYVHNNQPVEGAKMSFNR